MNNIDVYIEKCREEAEIPKYANDGDSGMDIYSIEEILIKPGETVVVKTGLKFAIPEGYEIQVRPRSGISLKTPIRVSNSPGTIDSGYRDEFGIILTNNSENIESEINIIFDLKSSGNKKGTYIIKKGDRIAQIVLARVPKINFKIVDSVKNIGINRGGGFGSTGIK